MRFSFDGKDYLLQFQYEKNQKRAGEKPLAAPNVTKCLLYSGKPGCHVKEMEPVTTEWSGDRKLQVIPIRPIAGITVRSSTEQHNKEKARKLSLERLLHEHTISWFNEDKAKQFRTAAWAAYFDRKMAVAKASVKPVKKPCNLAEIAADAAKMIVLRRKKPSTVRLMQNVGRLKRKKK
jgi:hypothetical protein